MYTTVHLKPDAWAPLRHLLQWLWPETRHTPQRRAAAASAGASIAPHLIATRAGAAQAKAVNSLKSKPLRVVRVVESGQPRSEVGRMVISGRMADVCAELDRLAACEAA